MKKIKFETSQPIKKGKGKQRDSSSKSEEVSESDDEEIEAMFAEASDSEQEKWAQSIARRGLHCERGVKVDTFLFTHPIRAITDFDAHLFAEAMCTHPVAMSGFIRKEFMPGKLKPEYALMNKIIHDRIGPKGNQKYPIKEETKFFYEVMTGKLIDYALVIWCVMRDFLQSPTEIRHIPFPSLVTNLVEAAGMRGVVKEKRSIPKLGPITSQTEAKSQAASMRPQPSHPPVAIPGASSSSAPVSMSTSPLKRKEHRIKGWFKCILGKQKQLDHRLSRLESHISRGEPALGDAPPPDL